MFVHHQTKSLLFQATDVAAVMAAMPARAMPGQAAFNVAVKHTTEATMALREMGYENAPTPIATYYPWPGRFKPFDHQRIMAEFMTANRRCFNLSQMGTAKTNAALWAADWLMSQGKIKKVLVLSPLSTLDSVWQSGVFETLMHRRAVVVHGTREKRLQALASTSDFYILNHDGIAIGPILEALRKRPDIDHIIVDEGSVFRNSKTDKYRCLDILCKNPKLGLWWMTGTPCPNGPDDAWAQARLVSPSNVPKFFGAFRNATMMEVSEHVWKPRAEGTKIAYAAMQPAVRFAKKDCLDLPPVTTQNLECEMSPDQARAFKQMTQTMQIQDAEARAAGKGVTAANAADKVNKLRQIMLGSIKAEDGTYIDLDYKPRLKVLVEAMKQAQGKVIIICPFKGVIRRLEKDLADYTSVGMLNGDVPSAKRNRIINDFKMTAIPHALLCHPTVMAHGLNLTEADLLIFFGPIYSNDEYRQVVERFNRPGQTRKMTIIRIGCNAVEWAIYKNPDTKELVQASILQLYNTIVENSDGSRQARARVLEDA